MCHYFVLFFKNTYVKKVIFLNENSLAKHIRNNENETDKNI